MAEETDDIISGGSPLNGRTYLLAHYTTYILVLYEKVLIRHCHLCCNQSNTDFVVTKQTLAILLRALSQLLPLSDQAPQPYPLQQH